jgi:arylsulfatase A-like enzyme
VIGEYQTYISGKWHVGKHGSVEQVFDEFYGMLGKLGALLGTLCFGHEENCAI